MKTKIRCNSLQWFSKTWLLYPFDLLAQITEACQRLFTFFASVVYPYSTDTPDCFFCVSNASQGVLQIVTTPTQPNNTRKPLTDFLPEFNGNVNNLNPTFNNLSNKRRSQCVRVLYGGWWALWCWGGGGFLAIFHLFIYLLKSKFRNWALLVWFA